jgi:hypothetical protein
MRKETEQEFKAAGQAGAKLASFGTVKRECERLRAGQNSRIKELFDDVFARTP